MKFFNQTIRVTGYVQEINTDKRMFIIKARSGDEFEAYITDVTYFYYTKNADKIDRDRTDSSIPDVMQRYLQVGKLVATYGIYQMHGDTNRYDVKNVAIFGNNKDEYTFEEGHWWLTQITAFADTWLKRQWGHSQTFDFTQYRTDLTAAGTKIEGDTIQECDTIARLVYGLSSAYLLSGNHLYLDAAKAGVEYQRNYFRTVSHDGTFIVWHHAVNLGEKILPAGPGGDDDGTIPLYEQIYAIAGLAQYYRATCDWETLQDILRTMKFFEKFYKDDKKWGFWSHLDPVTLRYDTPTLGDNKAKKNWNSVGDHTPAYLTNLLLAIENIPEYAATYNLWKGYQKEIADIICDKFVDPTCPYVNERFDGDWNPDHTYKWQQNRAVVGHNLKIAWNLTRVYHYLGEEKYLRVAKEIGDKMPEAGMDQVRSGWFDVVERQPKNGMPIDFTWHNRKAWWQQEQAILAYLILAGSAGKDKREQYLTLARESIAFWNMSFLDQDYGETYFDVLESGIPFLMDDRAKSASHSKSGYHSMELNYLAHIYYKLLVTKDKPVCLYFNLSANRTAEKLNVLPDHLPRNAVEIESVKVDGIRHTDIDYENFQVVLDDGKFKNRPVEVMVMLRAKK